MSASYEWLTCYSFVLLIQWDTIFDRCTPSRTVPVAARNEVTTPLRLHKLSKSLINSGLLVAVLFSSCECDPGLLQDPFTKSLISIWSHRSRSFVTLIESPIVVRDLGYIWPLIGCNTDRLQSAMAVEVMLLMVSDSAVFFC